MHKKLVMTLPLPAFAPKAIVFGCIDCRLIRAHNHLMENCLGYDPGEYFTNNSAGSLNDLIHKDYRISLAVQETLRLAVQKGIETIVLTAHTKCAADAGAHRFESIQAEQDHQIKKLADGLDKIIGYARAKSWKLEIKQFLLDIKDEVIEVIAINQPEFVVARPLVVNESKAAVASSQSYALDLPAMQNQPAASA